jgi:hypothetical protein
MVDYQLNGFEDAQIRVTARGNTVTIFFKATKMSVVAQDIRLSFRHLGVSVRLPSSSRGEDIRGLLGTPDGNYTNDWMASNGGAILLPTNDFRGEAAYNYCTKQWCIRSPAKSLFVYKGEFDFNFFSGCDDPFPGNVDLSGVTPELRALCGTDQACLIDGIELGIEGARSLLETEAAVSSASLSARFRATPAAILVNTSVTVALTVNLTGELITDVRNITEFVVYRVNSQTFEVGTTAIIALRDIGFGVGTDTVAGDLIFSNILATSSETVGESFSFRAVPIIGGVEYKSSLFVFTALNAVRSYSRESGIGGNNADPVGIINADTIEGLTLVIEYSWPADQRDLDTGTVFLGSTVGYLCGGSVPYIFFSGDDTKIGGKETVKVRLGISFNEGQWVDEVFVDLNAGWFGSNDRGPASVTAYTERDLGGGTPVVGNNAVSFVIDPGFQSGCASTKVGVAKVLIGTNGNVMIELIPNRARDK